MFNQSFPLKFAVISALISSTAWAANMPSNVIVNSNPSDVISYWTPERMRDATPMDLPQVDKEHAVMLSQKELKEKFANQKSIQVEGAPPTDDIVPQDKILFTPRLQKTNPSFDVGKLNEQFTSAQLTPLTSDQSWPYRTTGKLFFSTPNGNKTCSASVIANRIIVTAGHCMHSGNNSSTGWYGNWMFVPAFRNGSAPFSTWAYNAGAVTSSWFSGGGTIPHAADWGMLEMKDLTINGAIKTVGAVVGKLGFKTLSTIPNHVHVLGYAGNLDSGQLMHQVTAQSSVAIAPNNGECGSDMALGAGGGPWIQNFGKPAAGQIGGTNSARNLLVGVTSYGFNDTVSLGNGTSILDDNFVSLYNFVCARQSGNC